MNRGLVYLLRQGPRRKLRHLARRTRGARRKVLSALAVVAFAMLLVPQVMEFASPHRAEAARAMAAGYRMWGPLALAVFALLGVVVGYGLHFRPAEIDFLFPAPIPRRELVLYNVVARLGVAALSSRPSGACRARARRRGCRRDPRGRSARAAPGRCRASRARRRPAP